ncbi:hypothetical protein HanRHA438_Chr10g0466371 [Helianthus annuus]|nr:hypothetical protein HanRHA438_Chr10g0466371 [Helianthus annuus]
MVKELSGKINLDMSTVCHRPKSKLERITTCFFPEATAKLARFLANSTIIPCL